MTDEPQEPAPRKKRPRDTIDLDSDIKEGDAHAWIDSGSSFSIAPKVEDRLPAGCYLVDSTMDGRNIFIKQDVTTDDLIIVPDSVSEKIVKEIQEFWELKDTFKQYGFLHKRGILLTGPPGGGKTVTINLVIDTVINKWDGIAIYIGRPFVAAKCLRDLRIVEKNRPVVCIIEDIDEIIAMYGEGTLLDLLDGGQQIENVVFIATTNHVEKLEARIVNRPSRFDTVVFVRPPNADLREAFFKNKIPDINQQDLDKWVRISEGLSFAHLKEMVIMSRCFGRDIDEVVDKLQNMDIIADAKSFEDEDRNPIGFAQGTPTKTIGSITKEFNK